MVFYMLHGKLAETWRQWVFSAVVRNTQRAFEVDAAYCVFMQFRKAKKKRVFG